MAYSANQIRNKEQHREDRKAHNDITNKCVSENFRNPTWKHKSNDNNAGIATAIVLRNGITCDHSCGNGNLVPGNSHRFYRFYGDKAYNYYAVRALKLKLPDATRKEFVKITGVLVTRKFLSEVAKVCELDKMMLSYNKAGVNCNLGEMMEAYCSGMLFNGMEEEMKKFTSDVVDYYLKNYNK
ncbi:hypothetical protein RhiirB3_484234 [Rhizophagus irregularis]|nr:hypothetical protein RhiirB3_484234 [Rhizophagus irregularis]